MRLVIAGALSGDVSAVIHGTIDPFADALRRQLASAAPHCAVQLLVFAPVIMPVPLGTIENVSTTYRSSEPAIVISRNINYGSWMSADPRQRVQLYAAALSDGLGDVSPEVLSAADLNALRAAIGRAAFDAEGLGGQSTKADRRRQVTEESNSVSALSAALASRRANVDGLDLFYLEAGPKEAPTVVLLHGYPSSSRMYAPLIPLLADRYHLIAPDYPGFGQSEAPPPSRYCYTFDHLAETMGALLEHLNVDRYVLFMQDYGGPVGLRMAVAQPQSLQALIVQNANTYQEGLGPKWAGIARYWADPAAHPEQLDAFTSLEGAKQRHLGNTPHPERYNPDTWREEFALLSRPGQREIQAALLYDYRANIAAYPAWQAWLREYRPATLVLWGRYDPSFIVPGALAYARDLPDAEIHILDAGHFALDEQADQVAQLTRDFLARRIRRSGS